MLFRFEEESYCCIDDRRETGKLDMEMEDKVVTVTDWLTSMEALVSQIVFLNDMDNWVWDIANGMDFTVSDMCQYIYNFLST